MNVKKIAAVAAATGGLVLAGAGAASATGGGAAAEGGSMGASGILSGNVVQVPVHAPINVCGNSVTVIGLLNPAFGNNCQNF